MSEENRPEDDLRHGHSRRTKIVLWALLAVFFALFVREISKVFG